MTPDRWERVKELFDAAERLDGTERARFLATSCDDEALREEVESLLGTAREVPALLENTLSSRIERLFALQTDGLEPGQVTGDYRLLERIGSGGMATVWKAEHCDRRGRFVALKFLHRSADTARVLRRFASEQQLLAHLHHPNISQLLDAGVTRDGHPFLVMEYIAGVPIDEYCDRERLGLRERIELFRGVCQAVKVAHRNLIVHRDLKPQNILVTADGVPKLVDFGISKILDSENQSADATETTWRPLTPLYASPEQIAGGPITTAADVYSLGVVLYELLTGHVPRAASALFGTSTSLAEPVRPSLAVTRGRTSATAVREDETTTPAAELAARRGARPDPLRRRLRGDLDRIVLMAIRLDPERRYSSVEALEQDLGRYLAGMPVSAQRDTFGYRLFKFVGRNRASLLSLLLLGASVSLGGLATGWQMQVAAAARDEAEGSLADKHGVLDFLAAALGVEVPGHGPDHAPASGELADFARRLSTLTAGQPSFRLPLIEVLGHYFMETGDHEFAEGFFLEALVMSRELHGESSPQAVRCAQDLGILRQRQGRIEEAVQILRDARVSLAFGGHGALARVDLDVDLARALLLRGDPASLGQAAELAGLAQAELARSLRQDDARLRETRTLHAGILRALRRNGEADAVLAGELVATTDRLAELIGD